MKMKTIEEIHLKCCACDKSEDGWHLLVTETDDLLCEKCIMEFLGEILRRLEDRSGMDERAF